MQQRVAVTGAGGYIGRHVVSALLDKGARVVAVDRVDSEVDSRAELLVTDIFSGDDNLFERMGRPDVVIHMAWRDGFAHNAESHIVDLPAHYELIRNLVAAGLQHLVVMGSMHEVGYHEGAISEDTPCNPGSLYGIAKNALRQTAQMICDQNDVVFQWIRGFYVVGDDEHSSSIFAKLVQASKAGQEQFPFTTGKNLYDFLSVDELANQIACVALQDQVNGVINACSGVPMSLADRVESYIVENDLDIRLKYGAFPDRPYDSPGLWGDATKINQIMADCR